MKNDITRLTRSSKKTYYNNYFAKHSGNVKKLWAGVNQIINNKPKSSDSGPTCIEIDIDGNVKRVVDPQEIANQFN